MSGHCIFVEPSPTWHIGSAPCHLGTVSSSLLSIFRHEFTTLLVKTDVLQGLENGQDPHKLKSGQNQRADIILKVGEVWYTFCLFYHLGVTSQILSPITFSNVSCLQQISDGTWPWPHRDPSISFVFFLKYFFPIIDFYPHSFVVGDMLDMILNFIKFPEA